MIGEAVPLVLLFRSTGILATERQTPRTRTDYAEYQRTTGVFAPFAPRVNLSG